MSVYENVEVKTRAENLTLKTCLLQAQNACIELQERLREAEKVIGFYGNIENWRNPKYPQKHDFNVLDSEDGRDVDAIKGGYFIAGKRARQYLEKYKGEK